MRKRSVLLVEVVLAVMVALGLTGCDELASSMTQGLAPSVTESQTQSAQPSQTASSAASGGEQAKPVSLVIEDEAMGKGHAAKPGDKVTVSYTAVLSDGTEFASGSNKKPLSFRIGSEKAIRGLSRGVIGMTVGGKRKLTVQPELAYGEQGGLDGAVPPNAVVVYEVELLKISK